jgi:hypothetical protein
VPLIVIYPDLGDFDRHLAHRPNRYEPLLQHLQRQGFRYLDLLDAFVAYDPQVPKDRLTVGPWGHYSHHGNQIVANHLYRYLVAQGLMSRDGIASVEGQHQCTNTAQVHPEATRR